MSASWCRKPLRTALHRHVVTLLSEQAQAGGAGTDRAAGRANVVRGSATGDTRSVTARGDLYVCTWLFAESETDESAYPQVPGRPSSPAFQATYWRCVAVFFATSYRQQPWARHVLFTNTETIPSISGVDLRAFLQRLDVEVVQLPLTYVAPQGHFDAWRNQFYVFDIANHLGERIREDDSALLLDSDCVWIDDASALHEAIGRDGVLTYVETYPVDWRANGMTREDMRMVSSELLGYEIPHPLVYCGGEFLAASGRELQRLGPEIDVAWQALLDRHERGKAAFNEEAQLLSHVYYKLGYPLGNGDPFVRRIWTGSFRSLNTALPHDHGLIVWHLPLEKRFGLARIFGAVVDSGSTFWSIPLGRPFKEYLGASLGVPHNSLTKKLRDLGRRIYDKLRYR